MKPTSSAARAALLSLLWLAACTSTVGERKSSPPRTQGPGVAADLGTGAGGATGNSRGQGGATPAPGVMEPVACKPGSSPRPGTAPLRRLTRFEYNNTVRDLLGVVTRPADGFVSDGEAYGFDNNATLQRVTRLQAEQFQAAAIELAATATQALPRLLPCDPQKVGDDACASAFIAAFGRQAYRRPLAPEESALLTAVYSAEKVGGDFKSGIELVIQTVLQASAFLYRVEVSAPVAGQALVPLGSWAMASRLSYLLWGTMPDDELFRVAEAGQLGTKEQIAGQALRMLMDPRARTVAQEFYRNWLRLDQVSQLDKDMKVYPAFSPDLPALWRKETETFVDQALWEGGDGSRALFTASYSFVNPKLAAFYGVPAPMGEAFARVEMDPAQRGAGILTQAGLLALLAKPNQSSPVQRGVFVRERLLCQALPPPPANVDITPPEPSLSLTTRERFSEHSNHPACAGCHRLIDPLGLGFENYDGIGKWRAAENGTAVDATGEIFDADIAGHFVGAGELGRKLAESDEAHRCQTLAWFRYASGRGEVPEDACTIDALKPSLTGSGGGIREFLVAFTQTDSFRFRSPATP